MLQTIHHPLVVVSDIHLIDPAADRAQLLQQTIARLVPGKVSYFILLGDIFDFCFGASDYFRQKYALLGESLSRLAQGGTQVIFLQGNHEFALAELKWPGVEFVTCREKIIALENGVRLALTHGDRLGAPWHYHLYVRLTRAWLFKHCAKLLPQAQLDRFSLGLSQRSRAQDPYRKLNHRRILDNIEGWLAQTGCHHGIVGHFHVPYDMQRRHGQGRILCLPSWDQPNFLSFDGEKFHRHYL